MSEVSAQLRLWTIAKVLGVFNLELNGNVNPYSASLVENEMGSESQNRLREQPNKFERVHASPWSPFSGNQNVTIIILQSLYT